MFKQLPDHVQALLIAYFIKALVNLGVVMLLQQFDWLRIAQELLAQPLYAFRIGGRKEQSLPLHRAGPRNRRNVVEKAHVEHPVGFVEHQQRQCLQVQAATFQVIHDAARRADHDMRAMLKAGHLRAHLRTAA